MTELELYKFVIENEIEYHWYDKKCIMFVDVLEIGEFINLLGDGIMEEEGIECRMKKAYFCFDATEICDYFGINADNIFTDKNN